MNQETFMMAKKEQGKKVRVIVIRVVLAIIAAALLGAKTFGMAVLNVGIFYIAFTIIEKVMYLLGKTIFRNFKKVFPVIGFLVNFVASSIVITILFAVVGSALKLPAVLENIIVLLMVVGVIALDVLNVYRFVTFDKKHNITEE